MRGLYGAFKSALGCTIEAQRAPEHLGEGILLTLRMDQGGDGRETEVFLDTRDIESLKTIIKLVES